jgi:peptidoglycan/LPS O-acetylase OafA/YrhL
MRAATLSPGFSTWLNLLRAGAAVLVLLSHWAYPRFTEGRWLAIRDWNLGSDAVVLFFVLSGLVIAFAAAEKDRGPGAFLFARATRLWSVALPALLVTFAADRLGAALAPAAYDGWWYAPQSLGVMLAAGLSFANEWGGLGLRLGTNGPWWSLSYEVAYYLLFAAALWLTGWWRAVVLVLGLTLAGLPVLLLKPCWLMGVARYRALARGIALPSGARAWGLALLPLSLYIVAQVIGLPAFLAALTEGALGPDYRLLLRFSDEVLWNTMLAAGVTAHLWGMAGLLRDAALARLARPAAWLAGGSFSLYLVHYPLLQLADAVLPEAGGVLRDAGLLALVTALCLVFAAVFERTLPAQRRALRRLYRPSARASAAT